MAKKNSIKNKFNMFLNINILADVFLALFGIFLLFDPETTNKVIGSIVGCLLIFYAATLIYTYISRNGAKLYSLNIIFGVLIALLGIVLIVYPYSVMSFITTCIGLFLIVNGASKINYALWLRKGQEETWVITLATGILLIAISLVFMFTDFVALALTQVLGIFLLCAAAINLMDAILFRKRSKEIVKIFW